MKSRNMHALAILLASIAVWPLAQAKNDNLLSNPGFEELGPDGKAVNWVFSREGSVMSDEKLAHRGKTFARVRFDDRASQTLDCRPGSYYLVEGWVRAENPETRDLPRVKVYFLRPDGSRAFVTGGTMEKRGIEKWEHFAIPVRAPHDAETVQVALIGAFGGQDWFLFDDVALSVTETREWSMYADVLDLNGKTVVVPHLADVHSFATYRIPPQSLTPIDGRLSTAAWTGRSQKIQQRPPVCDFDVRFREPTEFNWVLVHALSPTRPLGRVEIHTLPPDRHDEGKRITRIPKSDALVHSVRFKPAVASGFRLRMSDADQRTTEIHEIQAFRLQDGLGGAGEGVRLANGVLEESDARLIGTAYPATDDQQALTPSPSGARAAGDEVVEVKPGRYLHIVVPPTGPYGAAANSTGVKLVTVELSAESLGKNDIVEICLKQPAELDTNIVYAELNDRGLPDRLKDMKERNFADAFRVVSRLPVAPLRVTFDIPDIVLQPGEKLWLTVRSEKGLRVKPQQSRVFVLTCAPEDTLPQYLARVERLAVRAYARASEAHVYDGRPYRDMMLYEIVQRVLRYNPDNVAANHILRRIALRWSPVEVARPGPEDAPDWAVWGRHAAREWKRIADWWIDNRWVENGELGGNLNDDVEYTCHWPLMYLITGDDRIRQALGAIADAVWEQSGETGYSIQAVDVEHAAEDSSCSLPQMLLCEYGSPVHVERMIKMSEHIPFWTGINDRGRRHFRSYMFNTRMIRDEPPDDVDHLYCALAMCGAAHLAWYCHNPQPWGWVHEYAQAWADVAMRSDKGKPVGALPCDVHFETGEIAPYRDAWNKSVYYTGGHYVMRYLLLGVARLTQDPALQPAADHQLGTIESAIESAEAAMQTYANPPASDPADPTSLDGTWRGRLRGNELQIYRATMATGKKEYLVGLLQEVAREFERSRWLLTEAEPYTDRIPVPGTNILRFMFLGGDVAGKTHVPGLAVSWEGGGTDFAALVLGADEQSLKVLLYSFADEPLRMAMRTWRLEHGRYEWTFGIDEDGDDMADGSIARRELDLLRHARVAFALPPQTTVVIEIRQLERLDPLTERTDLGLSARDIERKDARTLAVTVHNIGAAAAENVQVCLLDASGGVRAKASIATIAPPADVKPKQATVELVARSKIRDNWYVVVDPEDRIPEICETNNALAVGDAGPRSPFLTLRPRRTG